MEIAKSFFILETEFLSTPKIVPSSTTPRNICPPFLLSIAHIDSNRLSGKLYSAFLNSVVSFSFLPIISKSVLLNSYINI